MGIFHATFRDSRQLRGYGIFKENVKGVRDTQTPPPPSMGPLYLVTCLKGKKSLRRCFRGRRGERVSFISPFWFVKLPFCLERLLQSFFGVGGVWKFAF